MKPALKPSHFFRTAYFINWLQKNTGKGSVALEKQIRINQYERNEAKAPAKDTVRDYFRLRRSPAIDPQQENTPPWLFAAELEFPGSAYVFFHPLFDLLLGQMESSVKWSEKLQRIPKEWILEAANRGDKAQAEEWRAFNVNLVKKRGRKRKQAALVDINFIHMTLMRLPEPYFSILFDCFEPESAESGALFARSYRPIDEEIRLIQNHQSMDSLAALVGMVIEAAEIGSVGRFGKARKAVCEQLRVLDDLVECRSVREGLKPLIEDKCLEETVRTYPAPQFYGYGLPATWRGWNAIRHIECDLRKILSSALSNDIQKE